VNAGSGRLRTFVTRLHFSHIIYARPELRLSLFQLGERVGEVRQFLRSRSAVGAIWTVGEDGPRPIAFGHLLAGGRRDP